MVKNSEDQDHQERELLTFDDVTINFGAYKGQVTSAYTTNNNKKREIKAIEKSSTCFSEGSEMRQRSMKFEPCCEVLSK